jgi:hypothetical protein
MEVRRLEHHVLEAGLLHGFQEPRRVFQRAGAEGAQYLGPRLALRANVLQQLQRG